MSPFSPVDLIQAHAWRRALFTTYSLSLSFFESVVLDGLVRNGTCEAFIMADADGVRNALSELGARRVGRDYEVEPVAVGHGRVFHPKVATLASDTEIHLLVGSGNLTFGGWGGNLEACEHLHAAFAADALEDAAGFFEALAASRRARHEAQDRCARAAEDLRRAAGGGSRNGGVRLLHSLEHPILEQLGDLADGLGGAERLAVASPFWDRGDGLDRLCGRLGLGHAYVHAHGAGAVEGTAGLDWPRAARVGVEAVRVEALDTDDPARRLHAKLFEVVCRRGRVVLSGSANATLAALGGGGNVEACVARVERGPSAGWRWAPAEPPPPNAAAEDDGAGGEAELGVLRAVLQGDEIAGRVLCGGMEGPATALAVSAEGRRPLGATTVRLDGTFSVQAPGLEREGWKGARVVLRLEAEGGAAAAEGFVSFAAFAEIVRRAGPIASRLFAMLAGSEVPGDVAAIMGWACENPDRLRRGPSAAGSGGGEASTGARTVRIADLLDHAASAPAAAGSEERGPADWSRFMDDVFAACREPRGPLPGAADGRFGDDEEDGDDPDGSRGRPGRRPARGEDPAVGKALANFDRLFAILVEGASAHRDVVAAYELAQYVCDRLRPDAATTRRYLFRLVAAFAEGGVPDAFRQTAAAATLVAFALERDAEDADRRARHRVLRIGCDPAGPAPDLASAEGFRALLAPDADLRSSWTGLRTVRTMPEQIRAYLADMEQGRTSDAYPDLKADKEEWSLLERAITTEAARRKVLTVARGTDHCPKHGMVLPRKEAQKLKRRSVARAPDCCGSVLLCKEI